MTDPGITSEFRKAFEDLKSIQIDESKFPSEREKVRFQRAIQKTMTEDHVVNNKMQAQAEKSTPYLRFIHCKINGKCKKGLVDTGADISSINIRCAEKCSVNHLVDPLAGVSVGAGAANIIGQIHSVDLEIGDLKLNTRLKIVDNPKMDFLIALDILLEIGTIINLQNNFMTIRSGERIEFLPPSKLPEFAQSKKKTSDKKRLTT